MELIQIEICDLKHTHYQIYTYCGITHIAKYFLGQNKKSNIPPIITGDNIENFG